jgi:hypothetical protein
VSRRRKGCASATLQVRQQVHEGAWARRSENTVLTALVRLAALHEPLRTALTNQVGRQLASPLFSFDVYSPTRQCTGVAGS